MKNKISKSKNSKLKINKNTNKSPKRNATLKSKTPKFNLPTPPQNLKSFDASVEIMSTLRSKQGCPWDKEQDHQSLIKYLIEETYELVDAIENKDIENMKEELGDVLLQVLFHAQIEKENKNFDIQDVIEALNKKLVERHTHVYSNQKAQNAQEALANWNSQKKKEQKKTLNLFGIPSSLPALQYAQKLGTKTKKFHFDWANAHEVFKHVEEELYEFKEAMNTNQNHLEEEFGDLIFTLVQTARHLNIDPENALRRTNKKVEMRWSKMQDLAKSKKLDFDKLNTKELNELWTEVKK